MARGIFAKVESQAARNRDGAGPMRRTPERALAPIPARTPRSPAGVMQLQLTLNATDWGEPTTSTRARGALVA